MGGGGAIAASKATSLYSNGIRAIRAAMRQTGVKRVIALSSGGTVYDPAAPWFYRTLLRSYLINTYLDMARMETILEESDDLDWTIVRLTYLIAGESKPILTHEGTLGEADFTIHYPDAAKFVVEALADDQWIGTHPVLGYPK